MREELDVKDAQLHQALSSSEDEGEDKPVILIR